MNFLGKGNLNQGPEMQTPFDIGAGQGFSTGMPKELLKHAIPDYLVWDPDLFSLRLSNLKLSTANTIVMLNVNESSKYLMFWSDRQNMYFLV